MNEETFELEERLINFSVDTIAFIEKLPENRIAIYLSNQLLRSSISPPLNYGEARSAESRNDFVHKMKVCLKEIRES
jgi:four helix bundle protein